MVDIAGAAAGPQLYSRPDPLTNGAQASQIATDGIAPDQASGVTASGNLDSEGEGTGSQGDFDSPASGETAVQAQLAGSQEGLPGSERPLSPIEEELRDFPPNAVVQPEETFTAAAAESIEQRTSTIGEAEAERSAETGVTQTGTETATQFGVSEARVEEARVSAAEDEAEQIGVRDEPEPRDPTGATDNPYNLANGAAGTQSSTGNPAAQPPGSTVDIAA